MSSMETSVSFDGCYRFHCVWAHPKDSLGTFVTVVILHKLGSMVV